MTLRCPACGVNLRVNEQKLAGRTSARCPSCRNSVPILSAANASAQAGAPMTAEVVRVACGSCGTRLKAPASRAGTTSHCPKCRAEVLIRAAEPSRAAEHPRAAATGRAEDSSGAATRRIDSRSLGLFGASQPRTSSEGMDLDAFIRTTEPERQPEPPSAGVAAALMKPPVAEMEKIAGEIREAAHGFAPTAPLPAAVAPPTGRAGAVTPIERSGSAPSKDPAPHHRAAPARAGEPTRPAAAPYPAARGSLFGAVAGLLVGAASAGAAALGLDPIGNYLSPLPLATAPAAVPQGALRVGLPILLGALSGFMAAAAGSPTRDDRPLRLLRAIGFSLLAGLACGMVTSLSSGEGLRVWPIASWMRDLFLAGLMTTALDRMVPLRR